MLREVLYLKKIKIHESVDKDVGAAEFYFGPGKHQITSSWVSSGPLSLWPNIGMINIKMQWPKRMEEKLDFCLDRLDLMAF